MRSQMLALLRILSRFSSPLKNRKSQVLKPSQLEMKLRANLSLR